MNPAGWDALEDTATARLADAATALDEIRAAITEGRMPLASREAGR